MKFNPPDPNDVCVSYDFQIYLYLSLNLVTLAGYCNLETNKYKINEPLNCVFDPSLSLVLLSQLFSSRGLVWFVGCCCRHKVKLIAKERGNRQDVK